MIAPLRPLSELTDSQDEVSLFLALGRSSVLSTS